MIALSVTGLPLGALPTITVTGPGDYSRSVRGSETLTDLAPGHYTVSAEQTSANGHIYEPTPASQGLDVSASSTPVKSTIAYALVGSTSLDLTVPAAYLVQSVQVPDGSIPLVAGRDAIARVFVVANQANGLTPTLRLRLYQGSTLVGTFTGQPLSRSVPQQFDEGSLNTSWNVKIPGSLIQPGISLLADVDPDDEIAETDKGNNSFPRSGAPAPLTVAALPPYSVRFVPIYQATNGFVGDVTTATAPSFVNMARQLHPIPSVDAEVRAQYTTQTLVSDANFGAGWSQILSEMAALRVADGSARYYFGVVHVGYDNGIAGIAYIGAPEAVGWDDGDSRALVLAHEVGHNWGRKHAPCGGASDPDPNWPIATHPGGEIGVYGLDVSTGSLKVPAYTDIMGYCAYRWISDYMYRGVFQFRKASLSILGNVAAAERCLLVWGQISKGRAVLEPAFELETRPVLPARAGPYTVSATGESGASLFSVSFDGDEVADLPEGAGTTRHFAFCIPLRTAGAVRELRLRGAGIAASRATLAPSTTTGGGAVGGPGGASPIDAAAVSISRPAAGHVRLTWNADRYPMLLVRDSASGDVLAFARSGDITLPTGKSLALTLSDGVRSVVAPAR